MQKSGFHWDTYQYLQEHGYLDDIETVPWEGDSECRKVLISRQRILNQPLHPPVHPQLHFISHISHDIKGEQLVAQFFRMIPDHLWLFKYGRIPLSFIMGQSLWEVRLYLRAQCISNLHDLQARDCASRQRCTV